MAVELVVVSWGGAYTASQQKAYHDPYMKLNPDIKIVNDDSAGSAVAKIRAMNQAGNVTWDLVDAVASDTMTLCDEGLIEVINHDRDLAPAPDGTSASKDFGNFIVSECFIPQIVYSTVLVIVKIWFLDQCQVFATSLTSKVSQGNAPWKRSRSITWNGR